MYSQKSQNPLVDQGELTPADARGHGEGGQVKAGRQEDKGTVISLTNRVNGETYVTEGNHTFYLKNIAKTLNHFD